MARSLKKGAYVDPRVSRKIQGLNANGSQPIKTWARACTITPDMVGFTFLVHNGRNFLEVKCTEDRVNHKLGEFAQTRTFIKHGGKLQKELEQKKKEVEIAAAKSAKVAADAKK